MHSLLSLLATGFLMPRSVVAETVHGVVVFSRHGDRTAKWYGSAQLTSLGAEQAFQVGTGFRERYLASGSKTQIAGISADQYEPSQIYASAPDSSVLLNTATSFLQGLYPPLENLDPQLASQTLVNGSESTSPLDGYQYVVLNSPDDQSPNTVWIKGDEQCPTYTKASTSFYNSSEYLHNLDTTRDFYQGFYNVLEPGVYNIKPENMTYKNAYLLFDLINVARIHNTTSPARNVSDEDMFKLRTLADSHELALNYNATESGDPRAIGAETLSGAILAQLNQTIASKGGLKFSLLVGSYDTFMSFFGIAGLLNVSQDFHGLPDYASTMTFELFSNSAGFPSNQDDLQVRWLFKNGSTGGMNTYPLFGTGQDTLPWSDFHSRLSNLAVSDVGTWCSRCDATTDFCAAFNSDNSNESKSSADGSGNSGGHAMSNAVAGVIGAFVALGVAGLVGGVVAFLVRRRHRRGGGTTKMSEVGSDRSSDLSHRPAAEAKQLVSNA